MTDRETMVEAIASCGCTVTLDPVAVQICGEADLASRVAAVPCDGCKERLEREARESAMQAMGGPDTDVYLIGSTYDHRLVLKARGFRWDRGLRAWRGRASDIAGRVPSGCRVVSYGEAALLSMDHPDSAF